ncbi:MAG: hypothetical protein L6V93_05100 [Clostridiales bacterium]|nr:MAG: hypothetical protein L6V93_05100 [Clostridiales bacterium]
MRKNYQWFVNGEIIDGAVNSTYTIETGLESGKIRIHLRCGKRQPLCAR